MFDPFIFFNQKVLSPFDVMHQVTFCPLCHLQLDHDLKHAHELRQAAFKLYASLGSNDEDIRKKVTFPWLLVLWFVYVIVCIHVYILMHPHPFFFSSDHRDGEHDGQDSQWPIRIQH